MNTLLASIGPIDIQIAAVALFVVGAIFTSLTPSPDETMKRATYVFATIGVIGGLYLLVETFSLFAMRAGSPEEVALPPHFVIAAAVATGAALAVAIGAFLASRYTTLTLSLAAGQGGLSLFAATVNTVVWTMAESGEFESITGGLAAISEWSRNFAFGSGVLAVSAAVLAAANHAYNALTPRLVATLRKTLRRAVH